MKDKMKARRALDSGGSALSRYNSLVPMAAAICALRERAIFVFHTDLAGNDFTAPFQTLANDPDSFVSTTSRAPDAARSCAWQETFANLSTLVRQTHCTKLRRDYKPMAIDDKGR